MSFYRFDIFLPKAVFVSNSLSLSLCVSLFFVRVVKKSSLMKKYGCQFIA